MIGTYVDDTVAPGDASFEKERKLTERPFESRKRNYDSFVLRALKSRTFITNVY